VAPPFDLGTFASTEDEATQRFESNRHLDPFPKIAPALLNTADLLKYIARTGMIYPFYADPKNPHAALKPASYAITVGGPYLYWREPDPETDGVEAELVQGVLRDGEQLTLTKNSIVYVTLSPKFRVPDYLAARFNLKIQHIYRGLLVGTGPLVDPGFEGYLSIPLHNLTANDYVITGGERLVWMEFTKLSANSEWCEAPVYEPHTAYVEFDPEKHQRQTILDYVRYAHTGPIQSSIPKALGSAERSALRAAADARDARSEAEAIQKRSRTYSLLGVLTVAVAIAALIYGGYTVVQGAQNTDDSVRSSFHELEHQVIEQRSELTHQSHTIESLRSALANRSGH
jgi:deoxycytidine triphosphate deaminase